MSRIRRYSQRTTLTTLSEINITPLLDLAFVLLIIFIITTPLIENSVSLAILPTSSAGSAAVDAAKVQTISIDRAELITFNDEVIDATALTARLNAVKQANPDVAVVIRPDRELPVQKLIMLMDAVQRAQITKVGVATKPETP
jgi:biopolymer transport protein ExbD